MTVVFVPHWKLNVLAMGSCRATALLSGRGRTEACLHTHTHRKKKHRKTIKSNREISGKKKEKQLNIVRSLKLKFAWRFLLCGKISFWVMALTVRRNLV